MANPSSAAAGSLAFYLLVYSWHAYFISSLPTCVCLQPNINFFRLLVVSFYINFVILNNRPVILSDCIFLFRILLSFTLTNKSQWTTHRDNRSITRSGSCTNTPSPSPCSPSLSPRILVPSDAVGAIIGKQGATVKQIKQTTHAK